LITHQKSYLSFDRTLPAIRILLKKSNAVLNGADAFYNLSI